MQLIDAANLESKDVQMVLTGVDYCKPDDMLDQMKRAIRKFFGEQVASGHTPDVDNTKVKEEDVNQSTDSGKRGSQQGYRGNKRRGGRYSRGTSRGGRANQRSQRRTNPLDEDGNPRACHICKSIFHFAGTNGSNCPDSYENAQHADTDESVNEVSDIKMEDVMLTECGYCGLLDSCCTANVMGLKGKEAFLIKCHKRTGQKLKDLKVGQDLDLAEVNQFKPFSLCHCGESKKNCS